MIKTSCGFLAMLAATLAFCGCGAKSCGNVSGTATFCGNPLAFGTITFVFQDGTTASATVMDGKYQIAKMPTGLAKVTVQSHQLPPPMTRPNETKPPILSKQPKPFVAIPQRYQDPSQSGLEFTVIAGQQTFDAALKP